MRRPISEKIRPVFDRMLATQEEIDKDKTLSKETLPPATKKSATIVKKAEGKVEKKEGKVKEVAERNNEQGISEPAKNKVTITEEKEDTTNGNAANSRRKGPDGRSAGVVGGQHDSAGDAPGAGGRRGRHDAVESGLRDSGTDVQAVESNDGVPEEPTQVPEGRRRGTRLDAPGTPVSEATETGEGTLERTARGEFWEVSPLPERSDKEIEKYAKGFGKDSTRVYTLVKKLREYENNTARLEKAFSGDYQSEGFSDRLWENQEGIRQVVGSLSEILKSHGASEEELNAMRNYKNRVLNKWRKLNGKETKQYSPHARG